jgi:heme-binding uptake protein ChaN (Tiki superfamily)
MTYSKQRLREVLELKRTAVRRIQSDIGELWASRSRKYIHEFNCEFRAFQAVCEPQAILEEARTANLIWIGDYHALARSQTYAAEFVRGLAARNVNLALAVEPVFGRSQKTLDCWMSGQISESEFLERIRYYEEWGCDWSGYKVIFETAREHRIPVHGVDCHPRNDMRSISRRDLGVARRIGRLLEEDPSRTLVVVFGESHLATDHLPRRVRAILKRKEIAFKELFVLQNVDSIYWKLQEQGHHDARAVRVRDDAYCVFNATPIEKYESFRQYLHNCLGGEEASGDWTLLAQTLMEVMIDFLAMKKNDYVVSCMPMPELNPVMVDRFQLGSAAEEFARHIHQACRGELDRPAERAAHDQFFVNVIESGLGYFWSKLLDSSRDGIEPLAERVLRQIGRNDQLSRAIELLVDPLRRPGAQHFSALRSAIEARGGKQKTKRMLTQLLGYALGRRLYHAYLQSRISRKEIHALFHDPLNTPNRPLECYRELHLL